MLAEGSNGETWYAIGTERWRLGDYAGAAEAFEKAIRTDPTDVPAWLYLGLAKMKLEDATGATDAFTRGLEIAPEDSSLWNHLGTAQALLEDWSGAQEAFERALALGTRDDTAWYNLGDVFYRTGREGEALYCWEQAAYAGLKEADDRVEDLQARGVTLVLPWFSQPNSLVISPSEKVPSKPTPIDDRTRPPPGLYS